MMRNDLYRQFLMPSREGHYDLSVWYELSRLVGNMQIVTNVFIVLFSLEACTLIFLSGCVFFG